MSDTHTAAAMYSERLRTMASHYQGTAIHPLLSEAAKRVERCSQLLAVCGDVLAGHTQLSAGEHEQLLLLIDRALKTPAEYDRLFQGEAA